MIRSVETIRDLLARYELEWYTADIASDLLEAYDALAEERDLLRRVEMVLKGQIATLIQDREWLQAALREMLDEVQAGSVSAEVLDRAAELLEVPPAG